MVFLDKAAREEPLQSNRDARIEERAYQIWLGEGRPPGRAEEHWRRAEREIDAETSLEVDEEIFRRDLNEVHLLIDFISSLPGKSLNDLNLPKTDGSGVYTAADAVKRISEIRFPPDPRPNVRAEDAATLLLAKDRLNDLARPARGRSVAYTTMFAGGLGLGGVIRRMFKGRAQPQHSRLDLAALAAPDLQSHVLFFKTSFDVLMVFVFVWLFFTSFSYWDVALGNSMLQRMAQIEQERSTLLKANPALVPCTELGTADPKAACDQVRQLTEDQAKAGAELAKFSHCKGVKQLLFIRCWPGSNFVGRNIDNPPQTHATAGPAGGAIQGNNGNRGAAQQSALGERPSFSREHANATLARWLDPIAAAQAQSPAGNPPGGSAGPPTSSPQSSAPKEQAPAPTQPSTAPAAQSAGSGGPPPAAGTTATPNATAQTSLSNTAVIAAVLSVLSIYVLPMMFGVLGTLVAMMRSLHDKIRDNMLSPRDLVLTLTGLPIGAIAGLAVGLFFNSQNGAITGLTGLPAGLSLSAAGLAFLAGYGADAFFSFLDSVRQQVFKATNPPPGSDAAAVRTEPVRPHADPVPAGAR